MTSTDAGCLFVLREGGAGAGADIAEPFSAATLLITLSHSARFRYSALHNSDCRPVGLE